MYESKEQKIERYLIESEIATEDEVRLVTQINGFNEDALNDILYCRTGYRDIGQIEGENWEENF